MRIGQGVGQQGRENHNFLNFYHSNSRSLCFVCPVALFLCPAPNSTIILYFSNNSLQNSEENNI